MKLMPVPGIENDIHASPVGDRPILRPENPQLKPTPPFETVARAPPGSPIDLRQRQPICLSYPSCLKWDEFMGA